MHLSQVLIPLAFFAAAASLDARGADTHNAVLYREMNRLFLVYMPWRLGVHRFCNDLFHPWAGSYVRHPVMRGWWKYVDIDEQAAARGRQ
jgi:hypothetical protein